MKTISLEILKEQSGLNRIRLLAYCLMDTHFYLIYLWTAILYVMYFDKKKDDFLDSVFSLFTILFKEVSNV